MKEKFLELMKEKPKREQRMTFDPPTKSIGAKPVKVQS
jgi:hypothetical protein